MHELILWAGFLGAWLLVAGPVWQAVVELRDEDFERERYGALMQTMPPPQPVSSWWWLLPPLRLYLDRRAKERWSRTFIAALPDEDYEALNSYMAKVRGWMLVGAGGFLIATKETYELVEGNEWPQWLVPALVVVMALAAVGSAAGQAAFDARTAEARRSAQDL